MRRKFMAWIMSIMMIATMMPTMAFAEGESAEKSPYEVTYKGGGGLDGGLYMSKTLDKIDKDGKGTITLETYVKGKIETSSTPMDIVLVLDVSGSMDDPISRTDRTKKINALKSSVNSFIDSVSADASKNDVDHKISIVKFAGDKTDKVGNDTYWEQGYTYNYSQIVQNLTDVRNGGATGLKNKVNSLSPAGATAAHYGMELANTEISKSTSADRNRVVIMFTDGKPTTYNDFDADVANGAITASKGMKDKGVSVYTIGMFNDADNSDVTYGTSNVNKYMHFVSSNYPNAQSMKNPGERAAGSSFYKTAKTASELEAIFEEISSETKDTELDESTIIRDVMSEYFETDGSAGNIKIYEAEYKGNDQFGEKTQITGDALSKYTVTADKGQVSVNGFDFEAVMDTPKVKGKKLIIEIPVKLKDSTISNESLSGKTIPSNNTDSAKSSIIKTTEPAQSWNFEIPKVKLPVAKTDISGTKTWVDDSNADNTRPDSITLKLYRNIKGGDKTEVTGVTPTWTKNGNTWTYEYKDLPKTDADGNVYTYTVKEELAATSPYEAKYDGNNITNSLKSGTTDFSGEKVWKDSDGKPIDNDKLPASIEIELLQNGESMTPVQKQTVTPGADNKWTYTFTGLPKYDKDGKRYQYSTKEHIDGYISGIDTSTGELTNTYNGGTTSYVAEKAWSDSENHPASVKIQLKQNGDAYGAKVTLDASNSWKHEFTNLPKYKKDGSKYEYSVEEDAVPGYESTQSELKDSNGNVIGTKITNKFADEKTKYTVKKEWSDPANHPGSIKIQLKQDGKDYGNKVTLNEGNAWSHEYTDLPKYKKDGSKYEYSVEEDAVPGYESTQTELKDSNGRVLGTKITNKFADEKTKYEVEKKWPGVDADKTPDSVEVELTKDGNDTGIKATLTRENGWKYKFTGLDKYKKDGTLYKYGVKELTKFDGYTSEVKDNVITNTFKDEKIDYPVEKKWLEVGEDKTPDSIEVELLRDGTPTGTKATLKKSENWKYIFRDLPKYNTNGSEYTYGVKELTVVNGYSTVVEGNTITNTYDPEKVSVNGSKTWLPEGTTSLPKDVTVELYRNIKGSSSAPEKITETTIENFAYSFTDLPKYDTHGNEYEYTIREKVPNGYEVSYDKENPYHITNTYTGDETKYPVEKKWAGVDNNDPLPAKVKVTLYRDGEKTEETAELTKDNNWKHTFTGLLKYRTDGTEYKYSVKEEKVDGYTTTIDEGTVTNTYTGGDTTYPVEKKWAGVDNNDPLPASVKVTLYKDGKATDQTVELTKDNNWKHTFTGLTKYRTDGTEYDYSVKEENINGYTPEYGDNTVTNTYTGGDKEYPVEKKWAGVDNNDPLPAKVKVTLYQDGKATDQTAELTEDNNWKHVFKDLKKYRTDGSEYEYSVKEEKVDGYTTEYGDNTVTNSYTGGDKVSVKGTKTWIDPEGTTHPTITIELYRSADGIDETFVKSIELADGTTDYEFTDLEKYATNGSEYNYTVKEKTVDGYTTSYDKEKPNNITNTIKQEKIDGKGTKTWIDADGTERPDVSVQLYRDGEKFGDPVKIGSDNKYEFKDLDKYDLTDGHVYRYTVRELGADGYITTIDGYDITNSRPIKTVKGANDKSEIKVGQELTYTISWTNASDEAVTATIKDTLTKGQEYVSGDEGAVVETKDGITTVKWENVAVAAGSKVEKTFTVKVTKDAEETVANTASIKVGDKPEISSNTTSVTPKIDISGEKIWKDKDDNFKLRPDSVKITLLANGEKTDKTTEATEASGWKYSFSDLPLYNDGKKIEYTVEETPVDNYLEPEYEVVNKDGDANKINITNSIDEELFSWTGDITVDKAVAVKVDNEYAPQKVTDTFYFALFSDKELTKRATMKSEDGTETEIGIEKLELKNEASGTVTFKDVPTGTIKTPVKYYLAETDKDGVPVGEGFRYTPEFGQSGSEVSLTVKDHDADLKVANVFDNKIDVSGKKTRVDDNDKYKQRPDDITVFLKQNGEDYKDAQENTYAVHASKDTDWAYTFKDLPEFDENGDRYEYSVDEAFVAYYDAVIDGMDITNTFDKKKYYDDNPATITVTKETLLKGKEYEVNDIYYAGVFVDKDHTTLLADEEGAYIIPLVLENESSASFEFKVPYHEDGTATYYITEVTKDGTPVDKVSGLKYKASVKGGKVTVSAEDSVASVTFTNSYEQPKVPKTGDSGLPLIWMLIGLMAAALAAAAWIIFGRRETRRL